jgi:hypothetical protein
MAARRMNSEVVSPSCLAAARTAAISELLKRTE